MITQPPSGALLNTGSPLSRGLRAFWPMNEGNGTIISDVANGSSTRFRAKYNIGSAASLRWDAGPFGRKPRFEGTSNEYLSVPLVSSKINNITFGVWFSATVTSQLGRLLFSGNLGVNGWGIYHSDGNGLVGTLLTVLTDGINFNSTGTGYTVILNRPTFAVATCRGASSWRLYIDGKLFSTGTATGLTPTVGTGIGTGIGADSAGSDAYAGWIDKPFVVERAWSDAEVYQAFLLSASAYGLLQRSPIWRPFTPKIAAPSNNPASFLMTL